MSLQRLRTLASELCSVSSLINTTLNSKLPASQGHWRMSQYDLKLILTTIEFSISSNGSSHRSGTHSMGYPQPILKCLALWLLRPSIRRTRTSPLDSKDLRPLMFTLTWLQQAMWVNQMDIHTQATEHTTKTSHEVLLSTNEACCWNTHLKAIWTKAWTLSLWHQQQTKSIQWESSESGHWLKSSPSFSDQLQALYSLQESLNIGSRT